MFTYMDCVAYHQGWYSYSYRSSKVLHALGKDKNIVMRYR